MSTLFMQTVVHGKTVQVMLSPESRTARIDIVDDESGGYPPRTMRIDQYVNAGMADDEIVRHVLEVAAMSVEQLARLRSFERSTRAQTRYSY
ncbi:hypothetical protein PI86_08515 [Burkholderia sp. A9]|uniref:Uncharacterized protein n=1 Tax=Burkholderia cepacia GG4 TaxID=1009846 RepID=A0A9W3PB56_BURCE|nr:MULTISPECIES: hypothetical protein [Burkholderia]AFQ50205.1 hypothetical protein GEM_3815 [Burkholderia cepacia GG4]KHK59366.1 hypothetical protein PI86_08515 [Burkholderia sp. A9]